MPKIIVVYFSKTGNTKKMAELVAQGAQGQKGEVVVKPVQEMTSQELLSYDGIIIGSPTYYGSMAWEIKRLLDESVAFHGDLYGKVGGAFSSAANIGGGNETVILDILNGMLIHGMIIQGTHKGDHYGPVSIGKPDARVERQCKALGQRVAELVCKICD